MSLATPPELYQSPELALLAILDELLQQTIYALFAAHPELTDQHPFHLREYLSDEVWVADAIYNQASALQQAVQRYREATERAQRITGRQDECETAPDRHLDAVFKHR